MAKAKLGRPALQGRRVVVKLEEQHISRAAELGGGNVAAGIRRALAIAGQDFKAPEIPSKPHSTA